MRRRGVLQAAALPPFARRASFISSTSTARRPGGERLRVHRQQAGTRQDPPASDPRRMPSRFLLRGRSTNQEAAEQQAIRQGSLSPGLGQGRRRVLPQRPSERCLSPVDARCRPVQIRMGGHGRDPDRRLEMGRRLFSGSSFRGRRRRRKARRFPGGTFSTGISNTWISLNYPKSSIWRPNSSTLARTNTR